MGLVIHFKRFGGVLLFVALLVACKKAEDRSCFKSIGDTATRVVPIAEFNNLELGQHFEVELVQDSLNQVEITGGENLVNLIEISENLTEKTLTLKNTNKCNFMRSYKKSHIKVVIHYTTLRNIFYEGSEPLKGTLKTDYLTLFISDGSGLIDMDIKAEHIHADVGHGWGDYTLRGTTKSAHIAVRSNGFCDVRQLLITDSVYVSNSSSGDIKLTAAGIPLVGEIKQGGNVYYSGVPSYISVSELKSGKLIHSN